MSGGGEGEGSEISYAAVEGSTLMDLVCSPLEKETFCLEDISRALEKGCVSSVVIYPCALERTAVCEEETSAFLGVSVYVEMGSVVGLIFYPEVEESGDRVLPQDYHVSLSFV